MKMGVPTMVWSAALLYALAVPKSLILAARRFVTSTLLGFTSLCRMVSSSCCVRSL